MEGRRGTQTLDFVGSQREKRKKIRVVLRLDIAALGELSTELADSISRAVTNWQDINRLASVSRIQEKSVAVGPTLGSTGNGIHRVIHFPLSISLSLFTFDSSDDFSKHIGAVRLARYSLLIRVWLAWISKARLTRNVNEPFQHISTSFPTTNKLLCPLRRRRRIADFCQKSPRQKLTV